MTRLGHEAEATPEEALELAAVNLSPQLISVNVVGKVNMPGRPELPASNLLIQCKIPADGANFRSNTRNVELVWIDSNGSAMLKRFKLDLSAAESNENNSLLRDGDSPLVNSSQLAGASDAH